jgi:TetR/AcrR family transcriptional regulator, transcriptional repressor for nem operon
VLFFIFNKLLFILSRKGLISLHNKYFKKSHLTLIDDWSILYIYYIISSKMKETKNKLLMVGAKYVHQKGFNNAGLQEILKEANVPKGSFYFYFKSKEQFGLEIIDVFLNFFENEIGGDLSDTSIGGLNRIRNFFRTTMRALENANYAGGCPIGNLSLEMGDINENFRLRLSEAFSLMEEKILDCLKDAQLAGEIDQFIDIKSTASFIINSWEGAIVRVKTEKSNIPMELLEEIIFKKILTN